MKTLAAALAAVTLCGCTAHLQPREGIALPSPAARVQVAGPLAVRAAAAPPQTHEFALGGGFYASADYSDFARAVARLLEAELARQGAAIGTGGKSLEIDVQHIDCINGAGQSACVIDYTITTGDGEVRGFQARDWGWIFPNACNGAVANAVTETLADAWVGRYLQAAPSTE